MISALTPIGKLKHLKKIKIATSKISIKPAIQAEISKCSAKSVKIYHNSSGNSPFIKWLEKLDKNEQKLVNSKIRNYIENNFGVVKQLTLAPGVNELKIECGPSYRIYFGIHREQKIILSGGLKKTQIRDIEKVSQYWSDFLKILNYLIEKPC
ncbi:putative addiction module killer protein [Candidatus Rubidus massiliensis]|nr:putative addiction module killer protein [Candidatus Rubidus massiliensis]